MATEKAEARLAVDSNAMKPGEESRRSAARRLGLPIRRNGCLKPSRRRQSCGGAVSATTPNAHYSRSHGLNLRFNPSYFRLSRLKLISRQLELAFSICIKNLKLN
ncbi:hypothetical protein HPP92_018118 [Vanilla planifolia]|uniref:Uncharacterized protein n=1 Tax=Vanilla planifolia TaxID=51239 RepID=A0A835UQA8_VANPL|nr:hypothetical protein HPP92_018707 [Vanilla planifolia]KAG0468790.1 hypothetical protein HPP92_018118 [Vanilla planifolia]